jgi:hypothetical protein
VYTTSRKLSLILLTSGLLVVSLLIMTTQEIPKAKAACPATDCWQTFSSPNQSTFDNILFSVAAVGLNDVECWNL